MNCALPRSFRASLAAALWRVPPLEDDEAPLDDALLDEDDDEALPDDDDPPDAEDPEEELPLAPLEEALSLEVLPHATSAKTRIVRRIPDGRARRVRLQLVVTRPQIGTRTWEPSHAPRACAPFCRQSESISRSAR
jgi:hypothetical protein